MYLREREKERKMTERNREIQKERKIDYQIRRERHKKTWRE